MVITYDYHLPFFFGRATQPMLLGWSGAAAAKPSVSDFPFAGQMDAEAPKPEPETEEKKQEAGLELKGQDTVGFSLLVHLPGFHFGPFVLEPHPGVLQVWMLVWHKYKLRQYIPIIGGSIYNVASIHPKPIPETALDCTGLPIWDCFQDAVFSCWGDLTGKPTGNTSILCPLFRD